MCIVSVLQSRYEHHIISLFRGDPFVHITSLDSEYLKAFVVLLVNIIFTLEWNRLDMCILFGFNRYLVLTKINIDFFVFNFIVLLGFFRFLIPFFLLYIRLFLMTGYK